MHRDRANRDKMSKDQKTALPEGHEDRGITGGASSSSGPAPLNIAQGLASQAQARGREN